MVGNVNRCPDRILFFSIYGIEFESKKEVEKSLYFLEKKLYD